MFSNENTYGQIDRYLLNEMDALEKKAFEEAMGRDEDLADEVEQQKIMVQAMDEHDAVLRNTVYKNFNESEANTRRKVLLKYQSTRKNRILSTLGIALAISLITFISTLFIVNKKAIKIKQDKSSAISQLEERLDELENKISDLEAQLNATESQIDTSQTEEE